MSSNEKIASDVLIFEGAAVLYSKHLELLIGPFVLVQLRADDENGTRYTRLQF